MCDPATAAMIIGTAAQGAGSIMSSKKGGGGAGAWPGVPAVPYPPGAGGGGMPVSTPPIFPSSGAPGTTGSLLSMLGQQGPQNILAKLFQSIGMGRPNPGNVMVQGSQGGPFGG
jgi:hypothetical protein